MLVLGPQAVNSTRTYPLELRDSQDNLLTGSFTGGETFAAKLWAGDDQAALVDLSGNVAWINAADATLGLTVPTGLIAALPPAFYRVQILLNPGVANTMAFDGAIELTAAPGAAVAPKVYGTAADMQVYAPWIFNTEDLTADQAGFAEARGRARSWINEQVMARYRKVLQDQAARHVPIVTLDPIVPTAGIDGGPWWGPSSYPDTTLQADETTMQGYLDSGYLMLNDRLKEAAAKIAISYVCANQIGNVPNSETSWQMLAQRFRAEAIMLLYGVRFKIDDNADQVADYEIL